MGTHLAAADIPRMAHQFSMISIMNAALVAQGQEEVVSMNDGSDEFRVLARNWPGIVEAELEDGLYNFTRQSVTLLTRSEGLFGYDDAFLLPGDTLHVRRVEIERSIWSDAVDWVQDGTHIHLNAGDLPVRAEVMVSSDPDLWSANFARGVQMKLEAVILRALKEEHAEAREMEAQAESYFQRARTASTRSRSENRPWRPGRIAASRFRRG